MKNRNFISKIRISKVTDYAALKAGKCKWQYQGSLEIPR